jgi:hypothetical protein
MQQLATRLKDLFFIRVEFANKGLPLHTQPELAKRIG